MHMWRQALHCKQLSTGGARKHVSGTPVLIEAYNFMNQEINHKLKLIGSEHYLP